MSEWLSKATEALRGDKDPEPQPFELDCDCGTHHGGFRRRKSQRIICRSCGTALFVLPNDPYPVPAPPEPRKKKRKRKRRSKGRAGSQGASTQAAIDAGRALAARAATGVTEATTHVATRTAVAGRSFWERIVAAVAGFIRFWTPFRLVVLSILVAIGVTAAVTTRSGSEDAAITRFKASDEAARQALLDGDIAEAQRQFAAAVDALDRMDRAADSLSCEVRQLHRETTAMQNLLTSSVFDIVAEADAASARGELDEFDAQFRLLHFNRWVVLEGPIARVGRSAEGGHYRIDIPAAIGERARTLVISGRLPAVDALKFRDGERDVIVAGQLRSCELARDGRSWVLRLDPQTAFLWSDRGNYAAVGLSVPDAEQAAAINDILATQSRANGVYQ